MNKSLFEILVCPICNGKLALTKDRTQLVCRFDKLAFNIEDDIPVMITEHATSLTDEQIENMDLL